MEDGEMITTRGDFEMPFSMPQILSMQGNFSRWGEFDDMIECATMVKRYSNHSVIGHSNYKKVWPAAKRDFVYFSHWRWVRFMMYDV
jgi:hypothetical protein